MAGKRCDSWARTCGGRDDSARAPRMRIRTGEGGRPAFAAEVESLSLGWRVCLRAGGA